jgi:hypothetical protein
MSYPILEESNNYAEYLENLYSRKEFNNYQPQESTDKDTNIVDIIGYKKVEDVQLDPEIYFSSAQNFVKAYMNPNFRHKRMLLKWQTGTGKSKAAGACGKEFIKEWLLQKTLSASTPNVFIITFAQEVMQDELLKDPAFGFASPEEYKRLIKLKLEAIMSNDIEINKRYTTMLTTLRRRITDKTKTGLYTFLGYKAFSTQLFIVTNAGFNVLKYSKTTIDEGGAKSYTDAIKMAIADKQITLNMELINQLKRSTIICDEIHEVYNLLESNNYGIAIQFVMDYLEEIGEPANLLLLSATPMTGAASEVVDLLNLLIPRHELPILLNNPDATYLYRGDFFERTITETPTGDEYEPTYTNSSKLLPGALEKISKLSKGRISFLLDSNTDKYPRREFDGLDYNGVKYFKVTLCPYSELQQKCFDHERSNSKLSGVKEPTDGLAVDSYLLNDICMPMLEDGSPLYASDILIPTIAKSSQKWRESNKIQLEKIPPYNNVITGDFLKYDTIATYSTKYHTLLTDLFNIIKNDVGKIFIYHNRVRGSGVLMIQEILKVNGIIEADAVETDDTRCNTCGEQKRAHNAATSPKHEFSPIKFVIINSILDHTSRIKNMAKFNGVKYKLQDAIGDDAKSSNVYGENIRIILGSKIMRQSYELKNVRHCLICSLPINYPIALQVLGRTVRNNSHVDLPKELRSVNIKFYVSMLSNGRPGPEITKYVNACNEYLVIQEVDKALNVYQVDSVINYEKIKEVIRTNGQLNVLPYEPVRVIKHKYAHLYTITFNAYGFAEDEINMLCAMYKTLFYLRPIWAYADLVDAINKHYVGSKSYDKYDIKNINLALLRSRQPYSYNGKLYKIIYLGGEEQFYMTSEYVSGDVTLDIESYMEYKYVIDTNFINLSRYNDETIIMRNFEIKVDELCKYILGGEMPELIMVNYSNKFHIILLKKLIEYENNAGDVVIANTRVLKHVLSIYDRFKILIYNEKNKITGFVMSENVAVFKNKRWEFRPHFEFDVYIKKNPCSIATCVMSNSVSLLEVPKLKIMRHKAEKNNDKRTRVRGLVCESYSTPDLNKLYDKLQEHIVSVTKTNKYAIANKELIRSYEYEVKTDNIINFCTLIKVCFLLLEEISRNTPNDNTYYMKIF